jgi:hypothetical protein
MGVTQLETFVSNIWAQTPTGKLLVITLEDFALELGLVDFWKSEILYEGMRYASTQSWIRHMFQFALDNNITINMPRNFFQRKRESDRTIMAMATEWSQNPSWLRSVNTIRMLLKVVWLSDIVTADGMRIDHRWLVPRQHFPARNGYQWPFKHIAKQKDWRIWKHWIRSVCQNEELRLVNGLGQWFADAEEWGKHWDCFVHRTGELLFIKDHEHDAWRRHVVQPAGRRRRYNHYYREYTVYHELPELVTNFMRGSYTRHHRSIQLVAYTPWPQQVPRHPIEDSPWMRIEATKASILGAINRLLKPVYIETSESLDLLFRDFTRGTTVSVSDGSYYPNEHRAAAAWMVESECRTQWILGSLLSPGPVSSFSAYRSEVTGLTAISVTMKILASCLPQPQHTIIGCDGQSALVTLQRRQEEINANTKSADLVSIITDIWTSLTMRPYPVHIQGHQDSTGRQLNRLEKMNILMDKLASLTAASSPNIGGPFTIPSVGIPGIQYNGMVIDGQLSRKLYRHLASDKLLEYYRTKIFYGREISFDTVCLKAIEYARVRLPLAINLFISKWLSDTLPTGKVLQQRQHRIFNRCPRCNHWGEDKRHILVCWDVRAKVVWDKQMHLLQQLLLKEQTRPDLANFILDGISNFRKFPNRLIPHRGDTWDRQQAEIGWENFISGFIDMQMINDQTAYYVMLGSRKKGIPWAGKLIIHCWGMIHKMWLGRNEVLHQKMVINSISGEMLLDIEVEREYDAGYNLLPQVVHRWFQQPKAQLLEQSIEYKKGWLLIVKTMKESLQISEYNIFSSSRALRRWIGLPQVSDSVNTTPR